MHRGWRDCEAFEEPCDPMSDADAWFWLIEHAAWKAMRRRGGQGQLVNVGRGQIHVSDRSLATAFRWDKKRVRRYLERLEAYEMVSLERDQSGTILTICNYNKYQTANDDEGPAKDQSGTTQEQGKQDSEDKSSSENISARDPFTICPPGCDAQHWKDFCANRKSKRLARTQTAYAGILRDLARLADTEWPPGRILQYAAEHGWGGIYDPRNSNGKNHGRTGFQQRSEAGHSQDRRDGALKALDDIILGPGDAAGSIGRSDVGGGSTISLISPGPVAALRSH